MMTGAPTAEPPVLGLTAARLERHFRHMLPAARVLSIDDLSDGAGIACVDGRSPHCVAGAPGGNAGLLILLLASWEQSAGRPLSPAAVDDTFRRYLDQFGSFYLHTDREAQDRLAATVARQHGSLAWATGAGRAAAIDTLVRTPPRDLQPALLEALVDPAHVGCAHLRLLLEESQAYGVRHGLVDAVLRSYFRRLWEGDPRLVLDILDGAHRETGVACIRTDRSGSGSPATVTACPRHGALELFVYHPDVIAWLHAMHAIFMAREGLIPPQEIPEQIEAQRRLGERQLETTLRRLAPGLPVFHVHVTAGSDAPEHVRVRYARRIPVSPA
jgi:hypothetical protein